MSGDENRRVHSVILQEGVLASPALNASNHARLIKASHERSRALGIDPNQTCAPAESSLTAEQLRQRIKDNQLFYDLVTTQMSTLYQIVEGSGFCMCVTDADGYILHMLGDPQLLAHYTVSNCVPGFLWTEEEVGTCAIGLVLKERIPVQVSGAEMYCKRGHHITNSASPVYDPHGKLLGVIVLSGLVKHVHIHTLGMVILTAETIRSQMSELEKAREVVVHNTYMNALMESDHRGLIALNGSGGITHINGKARALLGLDQYTRSKGGADVREDAPLNISSLVRTKLDWKLLLHSKEGFSEREVTFLRGDVAFPLVSTLDPITMPDGENAGGLLLLMEHNRVLKLVNEMVGAQARFTFDSIIGSSAAVQQAKKIALAAARGSAAVLLQGETGTGKELFAQAIHNASSRGNKPFVVINCGAIPRELLESELFGYVEGAFTGALKGGRPGKFELADGGTLFLDEIGDMPVNMQVKILRTLQSGEVHRVGGMQAIAVDLRVIVATNIDLERAVAQGAFREDLFYRVSTLRIDIPPLREREDDVLRLAEAFLQRIRPLLDKPALTFSASALAALRTTQWPGNIRQLENAVERAVNVAEGGAITVEDLGLAGAGEDVGYAGAAGQGAGFGGEHAGSSGTMLTDMECTLIEQLMQEHHHNVSKVAKTLGVSRPTLYRKLKRYGLMQNGAVTKSSM